MRATGNEGTLRVGYQVAAELGRWEMAQAPQVPRTFRFTAQVEREHAYWITQKPLDLVLSLGTAEWLWRDIVVERKGDRVEITLSERPIVSERAPVTMRGEDSREGTVETRSV